MPRPADGGPTAPEKSPPSRLAIDGTALGPSHSNKGPQAQSLGDLILRSIDIIWNFCLQSAVRKFYIKTIAREVIPII